jgi:DNA-binding HxlR family transcriptional regulator
MANRTYGQYCGLARALELVGERWALLVVRDLLRGPKRFSDLRRGLPRIPTNILAARLRDLEHAAIVRRRVLPRPAAAVVYELTGYGEDLKPVLLSLGAWGARSLGEPRPNETLTAESLVLALHATFQPDAAQDLQASYELHVGPVILHARIDGGRLEAAEGPLPEADLVLDAGPALKGLMAGDVDPEDALQSGLIRISGRQDLLGRFVKIFRIGSRPCGHVT